jgi:hypothetical protein
MPLQGLQPEDIAYSPWKSYGYDLRRFEKIAQEMPALHQFD